MSRQDNDERFGYVSRRESRQHQDAQSAGAEGRALPEPARRTAPLDRERMRTQQTDDLSGHTSARQQQSRDSQRFGASSWEDGEGATVSARTSTGMDAASLARVSAFTMLALSMVWPLTGFALFVWSLTKEAQMLGDFGFAFEWWGGILAFFGGLIVMSLFLALSAMAWQLAVIADQLKR